MARKPFLRMGLFTAWAASTGLLLVLVVLIAEWSLRQIEERARARAYDDASHRIATIRSRLLEEAAARPGAPLEEVVESARWIHAVVNRQASTGQNVAWIAVISSTGTTLARSNAGDSSADLPSNRGAPGTPSDASVPPEDDTIRYSVPVVLDGQELGIVEIALSARDLDAMVADLLRPVRRAFVVLGCVSFLVLLLGGGVMRQLLHRERTLDREAARQEHLAAMGALARRMVHEIRNPLNAMRMQIAVIQDMLADPATSVESVRTEHLERLDQEVTRLERLAKSFLAFGRPPKDEPERVCLAELIRDVAEFIRPAFERIGARVDTEIAPGAEPLCVRMDRSRLREVLLNLAENAREAMDGGGLTIRLARKPGQEVSVRVADTGRGIAESDLPMIFQGIRSTKTDGSGLGLLIMKRIVEDASGTVQVESQLGRGTCFEILLPLDREELEVVTAETSQPCPESSS